jgi:hypothetical protein
VPDYGGEELDIATEHKDSGLLQLSKLVTELALKRRDRAALEAQIKLVQEEENVLARIRIPELVDDLGLAGKIETKNGLKITIKKVVKASIKDANRDEAVKWFDENGLGLMVKDEFSMKLGRGVDAQVQADAIRSALDRLEVSYKNKKNVHPSSLVSFIKERDAAGDPVPDALLGVYRYDEAKIG